jgi:hypothetical protein
MVEVFKRAEAVAHDLVGSMALEVDDETDTATVVLVLRAV